MRYFYNEEHGRVVELGEGNRLTVLTELFIVDQEERAFAPSIPAAAVPEKKRGYAKKAKADKPERTEKGRKKSACGKCGKTGHNSKTCPDEPSTDASDAIDKMKFKPISPEKLHKVKTMLGDGESTEAISIETGLDEDQVDRMRSQLGY